MELVGRTHFHDEMFNRQWSSQKQKLEKSAVFFLMIYMYTTVCVLCHQKCKII
jgi:hypothetical protein